MADNRGGKRAGTGPKPGRISQPTRAVTPKQAAALADPADLLRRAVPQATNTLVELLERDNQESVRLAAAKEIYDRVFGKPVVRQLVKMQQEIKVQFIDADD